MPDAFRQLIEQASAARRDGRPLDARAAFAAALKLGRLNARPDEEITALKGLGQIEHDLGQIEAAELHYHEAVDVCRRHDDALLLAHTIRHLGDICRERGQWQPAEACYVEALGIYRADSAASPLDLANAIRPFALLKEKTGKPGEATGLWEEARALYAFAGIQAGVEECARHLSRPDGQDTPGASA